MFDVAVMCKNISSLASLLCALVFIKLHGRGKAAVQLSKSSLITQSKECDILDLVVMAHQKALYLSKLIKILTDSFHPFYF